MTDNDLDKYLEDIGIDVDDEAQMASLPGGQDLVEDLPVADIEMIIVDGDAQERTESFLVNLLLNFDPAYAVEITRAEESEIQVDIFGGDPGKIIGRGGRTLAALEYLTNAVLNRNEETSVRVNVDVGGYKRRRDERLRQNARKVAGRVRKTGRPVELEPMSAAERRVIHITLADEPTVMSESTGEGSHRRVVIKPSEDRPRFSGRGAPR